MYLPWLTHSAGAGGWQRALALLVAATLSSSVGRAGPTSPEERAVAYLVREVPSWPRENRCFSCHNNGDAARALFAAQRAALPVPAAALTETARWLTRPESWDQKDPSGQAGDVRLARIQFAAALAEANLDRPALRRAAELLAGEQTADGCWEVEVPGNLGSPTTYGAVLATALARQVLRQADPHQFAAALARSERWLLAVPVRNVFTAAGVLVGLDGVEGAAATAQRTRCLEVVRQGIGPDGGWGPFQTSPAEPFDTALVMLALARQQSPSVAPLLRRGRAYLLATQRPEGGWPETTRPAGSSSYAQHISTTAWALLALLATRHLDR